MPPAAVLQRGGRAAQVAAAERSGLLDEARSLEQQLAAQARKMDKALREAEARMQVALAAREAVHGDDLNLLEGGLLQRLQARPDLPHAGFECRGPGLTSLLAEALSRRQALIGSLC